MRQTSTRRRLDLHDFLFLGGEQVSMSLIASSVAFCTSASWRLPSSSGMACSLSSFLRTSKPSRRTWRTATRASSAYLCAILTISLRRCSLSSGMRMRSSVPSTVGDRPRLASRIALSTACTIVLSQTETESARGSGTLIEATWVERHALAIGLDMDRLQQRGAGAAGAQAVELRLERRMGALHAALQIVQVEFRQRRHGDPSGRFCLAARARRFGARVTRAAPLYHSFAWAIQRDCGAPAARHGADMRI